MTTVLLTGFEPFGGDSGNPSADAVAIVAGRWTGPERLVTATLPTAFDGADAALRALTAEHSPGLVIATGLAGGRAAVTPERVAINLDDARIPDNAGAQPIDEPIDPEGPAALFTTMPVKAIVAALTDAGVPAALSTTAGTFVCNHVFYRAMRLTAASAALAGFVHLPWSTETAPPGAPSLPLADLARALEIAIRTSLDVDGDVRTIGGSLH